MERTYKCFGLHTLIAFHFWWRHIYCSCSNSFSTIDSNRVRRKPLLLPRCFSLLRMGNQASVQYPSWPTA